MPLVAHQLSKNCGGREYFAKRRVPHRTQDAPVSAVLPAGSQLSSMLEKAILVSLNALLF
jgi:hypothetical protein